MNNSRILVVEDEPIVALDLQRRLEKMGYSVPAVAASGPEALASADLSAPDLVLMDINLEGEFDGVETAEKIRTHHRVPVVYLTAYSNDETLERAKVTEPYGYLLKPFDERELQTTIEIALYRHQAQQALHRAHKDLEQRVAERTAELHEANLSLQREVVERRRRAARQQALQQVREQIWRMQSRADIQKVLEAIWSGFTALEVPCQHCGMTVVDSSHEPPQMRIYARGVEGEWRTSEPQSSQERDIIVRIWEQDETAHRPDLEEEDLLGHKAFLREQFGQVRSVVDAPFSHGTLTVASDSPQVFSDSDIAVLEELTGALSEGFRRLDDLQQLAAERQRLAVTLRSIGESVVATDGDGRIVLINRIAESLTGWTSREAEGRPLSDVLQVLEQSTRQPVDSLVQRVLATGTALELVPNGILVSRNGAERLISTSSAPIRDDEGKTIGVVLVSRDVGAQRKMEEELLKSAKLESLGVLAGGIAHDFNNILTTIIGYLSLAKMDIDQEGELFANLSEVEDASKRATDLTHQLLAFSKGGAPVKKTASVAELITDSATFTTRGSNVRCTFSLADVLPPAEVDIGQMSQVIQNLVLNADQAMPEGGTVHVSAKLTEITATAALPVKPGQYIQIGVRDEGEGIAADNLSRIFDPYFTTKQEGSGLGLATAYAIVKNHDGHITVDSSPGQGAIFFVYLPASGSPVEAPDERDELVISGQGRILVLDDEAPIRRLAGDLLERLGYDPEFVEDGAEAVARYSGALGSENAFDAVIMDLTIPGGMGGREAMRRLLESDPEAKVIVSSGYSDDPVMADFREHGFSGVVVKPYDIRELSQVLDRVTRSENESS